MVEVRAGWVDGRDPRKFFSETRGTIAHATQSGLKIAAEGLRDELRDQIISAGLGQKMANAIGANVYPRTGGSLNAAGYVFPRGRKAQEIFESFHSANAITAKNRRWLAIPTDAARNLLPRGRLRPTPGRLQQGGAVKLFFVAPKKARGRYALLMGASKRTIRKFGKAKDRAARGLTTKSIKQDNVVYYVLVPSARLGKRVSFVSVAERWADRIPALIAAATPSA